VSIRPKGRDTVLKADENAPWRGIIVPKPRLLELDPSFYSGLTSKGLWPPGG